MATYQLSDEDLETAGACEQVPTILNASYCFTCWHEDEVEKQEGGPLTPFDTSSVAAGPWPFEGPEIDAKFASASACNLADNEETLLNQSCQRVSDEQLEAVANIGGEG